MTTELYANNAQTTISGAITNLSVTVQLQSGAGALFPNPTTNQFFRMTFTDAATGLNREIVYCTSRSGDVCTIQRAQEGTAAQNWSAGDIAANLPTAGAMSNFVQQTQFQNAPYIYGADSGSANTYQVSYTPSVTSLVDGMVLRFKAAHANTGASTFSPNGLTAKPVWGADNAALVGGEIIVDSDIWLQWNSSLNGGSGAWMIISSAGGYTKGPTPSTGDRSTKLATTQMFANEFAATLVATTGKQALPSGFLFQWFSLSFSSAGVANTFPSAFPNACIGVIPMQNASTVAWVTSLTSSGCSGVSGASSGTYRALAIGY